MKSIINIGTLLIGITAVFFSGCGTETLTQENTILLDQTEDYFPSITIEQFAEISAMSMNENYGELTRLLPITENGFPNTKEFSIDAVKNSLLGNEFSRRTTVQKYISLINQALLEADTGRSDKEGSVIIKVLFAELNKLSQSGADIRKLICLTDGMENSALLNFYDKFTLKLMQSNPDSLQHKILANYPLNDLNGIKIYFIYSPLNRTDSERFEIISNFYKQLFESFGATVFIGGGL